MTGSSSSGGIIIVVVTINKETGKVIAGPDIVSRGFVYVRESEQLIEDARERVKDALQVCEEREPRNGLPSSPMCDALSKYLYARTNRRPMILPIIMEV